MENLTPQPAPQDIKSARKGINWWIFGFFVELLLIFYLYFVSASWRNHANSLEQRLSETTSKASAANPITEPAKVPQTYFARPEYTFPTTNTKQLGGFKVSTHGSAYGTGDFGPESQNPDLISSMEKNGLMFASIEVMVENTSKQILTLSTNDFGLNNSKGEDGELVTFGPEPVLPQTAKLYPGQFIRGWITYKINKNSDVSTLSYLPSGEPGLSKIKIQLQRLPPTM